MTKRSPTPHSEPTDKVKPHADILDAIAALRVAFMREHLDPPIALYLASHEEGVRFLSYMRDSSRWTVPLGDPLLGKAVETAEGVYMEMSIMDLKVRWPANRYAIAGGFIYG